MQLTNTNENADSQMIDIPEGEYDLSTSLKVSEKAASEQALNEQKNNELLKQDPTEYLIWLLSSWEELTDDEKKIAETVVNDAFAWKEFSMDSLLKMSAKEKSELVRNLTAIKPYKPTNSSDMVYEWITDWIRKWVNIKQLKKSKWDGSTPTVRHEDLVDYFDKAHRFQVKKMSKLYTQLFPIWIEDMPDMQDNSHIWDVNWNSSISKEFSNVWREYFTYPEYSKGNTKS